MTLYLDKSLDKFADDYKEYNKMEELLEIITNNIIKNKLLIKNNKIINNIKNPFLTFNINNNSDLNNESFVLCTDYEYYLNYGTSYQTKKSDYYIERIKLNLKNYLNYYKIIIKKKNQINSINLINIEKLKNKLINLNLLIKLLININNNDIINLIDSFLIKEINLYKKNIINLHLILDNYKKEILEINNIKFNKLSKEFINELLSNYFIYLKEN